MTALKNCLGGSRRVIYDNVIKRLRNLETGLVEDFALAYSMIKERLMKFTETLMEKQLRARTAWETLKILSG